MDPGEPVLGSFIYPDMPQKGGQFQAQVCHLWTPTRVNSDSGRSWMDISVILSLASVV